MSDETIRDNRALRALQAHAQMPIEDQMRAKALIVDDFRVFWRTQPTEQEFSAATDHLVLFPELLYIMITKPR